MTVLSCLLSNIEHESCRTVISSLEGINKISCTLDMFVEEYPETLLVQGS